uniref:Uncharacterized protein n=1 Tax=Panagrellus redivivus TaxID=6233 RepID=A0A7E4W036_PANRE
MSNDCVNDCLEGSSEVFEIERMAVFRMMTSSSSADAPSWLWFRPARRSSTCTAPPRQEANLGRGWVDVSDGVILVWWAPYCHLYGHEQVRPRRINDGCSMPRASWVCLFAQPPGKV